MATFIQDGDAVDYVPPADVAVGEVVVQGDLVGVARTPLEAGRSGSLAVCGVFDFPKQAGLAFTVGAKAYWDAANSVVVPADGGGANKFMGKTVAAADAGDALVRVRLSQ